MTRRSIALFLLIAMALFGCEDEPNNPQGLHSNQSAVQQGSSEQDSLLNQTPTVFTRQASILGTQQMIERLTGIYDAVPYVFLVEADTFFVVAKGRWEVDEIPPYKNCQVGIVNQSLSEVIPVAFDKIYNPGATAEGCVEVELKGKRGLYQLDGKELLAAEFDGIFPARLPGTLVQVKKGNNFGWLSKNGDLHMEKSQHPILHVSPITSQQISYWKYDVNSPTLIAFLPAMLEAAEDSAGVLVPPSYLLELGTVPAITRDVDLSDGKMLMDVHRVNSSSGSIQSFRKIKRDIWALFSLYQETGIEARDYQIETNRLTILKEDLSVIDTLSFLDNGGNYSLCQEASYQLISDTLLEVKKGGDAYVKGLPYSQLERYEYYAISPKGDIRPLHSDRIFDFSKYVPISPEYFEGCFAQVHPDPNDEGNMLMTKHLSVEDLDIMRNEIFAEYGLTFKTEKWQSYFGGFSWYSPQHDNVDHLLTDLDKQNIKTILQVKEAMSGKEKEFLEAERVMYFAPG